MEKPTGHIQLFRFCNTVQGVEQTFQARRMLRLNASQIACPKEPLQTFVLKAFDQM